MTIQIAVRIPSDTIEAVDAAVQDGRFESRASAVRRGLELVLREQRDRAIAAEYAEAYGRIPQEEWIGEAGAEGIAEVAGKERASTRP